MNAGTFLLVAVSSQMQEHKCRRQEVFLCEVDEVHNLFVRTVFETKVDDDFLQKLWLVWVLVVVDNMVLQNVVRKF